MELGDVNIEYPTVKSDRDDCKSPIRPCSPRHPATQPPRHQGTRAPSHPDSHVVLRKRRNHSHIIPGKGVLVSGLLQCLHQIGRAVS
jgi:hypothetical protein